jgi:hypothetical protein
MFPIGKIVCHKLYAHVWDRVKSFLWQEDSTNLFALFKMAKLESDELLQPVEVAVNCSIVPSRGNNKLHPYICVVIGSNQLKKLIIKFI